MRKTIKYIHLLLSLPAGIVITITCLTGAFMVFDEYLRSVWPAWDEVYRTLMYLHRWLMDETRTTGKLIVGISTVFFIFILISGLAVWWPRRRKQWKDSLRMKRGTGFRRRLIDTHRILGVYAVGMLLLLSLTGLMWSFSGYRNFVTSVIKVDSVPERVAVAHKKDKETGGMKRIDFNQSSPERKLMRWVFMLHTGRWGGWFGPFLTFIAAIVGASLPVTGYWLFFRRYFLTKKVIKKSSPLVSVTYSPLDVRSK